MLEKMPSKVLRVSEAFGTQCTLVAALPFVVVYDCMVSVKVISVTTGTAKMQAISQETGSGGKCTAATVAFEVRIVCSSNADECIDVVDESSCSLWTVCSVLDTVWH